MTPGRVLDLFEDSVMVVSMATVTVLITAQVILRYVFNESVSWAEELARFIVVWMTFIGAGMGVRAGRHISVDLIAGFAPGWLQRGVVVLAAGFGTIFALLVFYYGGSLFLHALSTGQVSSAMRLPMFYVYLIFPLSGMLLAVRFVQLILTQLRGSGDARSEAAETIRGA